MAWAALISLLVKSAATSASVSHGLHDLTPAPYLYPKHPTSSKYQTPAPDFHNRQQSPAPYQYHNGLTSDPYQLDYKTYKTPNLKSIPEWYQAEQSVGRNPQEYSHTGVREYTVYRNPYAVTGPRELKDAVRTQDRDIIVSIHRIHSREIVCYLD